MSQCKYSEICKLEGQLATGTDRFCILHFPSKGKSIEDFNKAIHRQMENGSADFRHVFFPHPFSFVNLTFPDIADFRDIQNLNQLLLEGTTLKGLRTDDGCVQSINLQRATNAGPLNINSKLLSDFRAQSAKFENGVDITIPTGGGYVDLSNSEFSSPVRFKCVDANHFSFRGAKISDSLELKSSAFHSLPDFEGTVFGEKSTVDFSYSKFNAGVALVLKETLPNWICIDGTRFNSRARIEVRLGRGFLKIIAKEEAPYFVDDVVFVNVDLSECRLVGNTIDTMVFSNVRWQGVQKWRSGLYDEVATRNENEFGHIKEAYQALKQKYQGMGDNVRAGEFHYGEMEMKRRERGKVQRFFCPEFLYWALSGYGHSWRRAFGVLLGLVLLFAIAYMWAEDNLSFFWETLRAGIPDKRQLRVIGADFFDALYYSLRVAVLQKPEAGGTAQRWIQLAETILAPVQIALFILALRMRLKR